MRPVNPPTSDHPDDIRHAINCAVEDLIEWYNVAEPYLDDDDYTILRELFLAGRFRAWDCPSCGARVQEADPDDWGPFQGTNQPDRTSYPGNGPDDPRCDHCRCHHEYGKQCCCGQQD